MKVTIYVIFAILGCFSHSLWAESGEYQVELIVFSQDMPSTEVFDQMGSEITWPANLYELSDYKKAETLSLKDSYAGLSRNSAYQPLLHVGWVQKIEEGMVSAPVRITSPDGRINGFVLVQRSQALQLKADLEYSPSGDSSSGGLIYRLNESRQFKLDELNYMDHPKFGLIAKVSAK